MGWRWIWSWTDIHSSVPFPDTNARRHERKNKRTPSTNGQSIASKHNIYFSFPFLPLVVFSYLYTQSAKATLYKFVCRIFPSLSFIYLPSILPPHSHFIPPTVFPVPLGFRLRAYTHRVHICLLALCTYVPCCIRSVNSSVLFYDLSCLTIYFSFTLSWTLSIYQQESLYICITILPV